MVFNFGNFLYYNCKEVISFKIYFIFGFSDKFRVKVMFYKEYIIDMYFWFLNFEYLCCFGLVICFRLFFFYDIK